MNEPLPDYAWESPSGADLAGDEAPHAPEGPLAWLPISGAPKDGKPVVYRTAPAGFYGRASYYEEAHPSGGDAKEPGWWDVGCDTDVEPTEWLGPARTLWTLDQIRALLQEQAGLHDMDATMADAFDMPESARIHDHTRQLIGVMAAALGPDAPDVAPNPGSDVLAVVRDALVEGAATFRRYELMHNAKDEPNFDKAAANADAARNLESALVHVRLAMGMRKHAPAVVGRLLNEIDGLVGESEGVTGLHRNGDVASWDELLPGGRFERLTSLDDARRYAADPGTARRLAPIPDCADPDATSTPSDIGELIAAAEQTLEGDAPDVVTMIAVLDRLKSLVRGATRDGTT